MKLYRVFPWDGRSLSNERGGPLYSPRHYQSSTRHAIAHRDGILYCSTTSISAIAERIQRFRGTILTNEDLIQLPAERLSLVTLDVAESASLLNLNDPSVLKEHHIIPEEVATSDRVITQRLAARIYEMGAPGFLWWSSLKASWTNVTVFESRVAGRISVEGPIIPLTVDSAELIEAAHGMGVHLKRKRKA